MRKIFKFISVFSLLVAGLTLSAHLLLPHDHHFADPFSRQDNNCPASNDKSGQKSHLPAHCHAFNDLTSDKSRPIQISQNIQIRFITITILTETSAFKLKRSCISNIVFSKPIFDCHILEFSPLRAPPVLA
jgi:hypothetical protein